VKDADVFAEFDTDADAMVDGCAVVAADVDKGVDTTSMVFVVSDRIISTEFDASSFDDFIMAE